MTEKKKRELLRLYISGQITPEDRHALEVAAVDDMFLFEALEGYSTRKDIVSVPYTSKETARVLPIRQMLTMAASFLLIAAMAFIFNQYNTPSINEDAFAQLDNQQLMSESASQKKESATDVTSIEIEDQGEGKYDVILQSRSVEVNAIPSEVKEAKTVSNPSVTADPPIKKTAISTKSKEDIFVDSEINEDFVEAGSAYEAPPESPVSELQIEDEIDSSVEIADLADQGADSETSLGNKEVNEVATKARALPAKEQAGVEGKITGIKGIVRSLDDGEPLIGANVGIKGTDMGTTTDVDGRFTLPNDGTNVELYINYVGFETAYITASHENENEIFLESGQFLDEVVVTDLSKQQTKTPVNQAGEEAYPYVIKGIVKNSENGNRLVGANLSIPFAGISTTSDKYGRFTISSPKPRIKLRIKHKGYQSRDWEIYFQNKERRFMDIELVPKNKNPFIKIESSPVGGWTKFNEALKFKDNYVCAPGEVDIEFEIQENGKLRNLEVKNFMTSPNYSNDEIKDCIKQVKSFIENYGKWETNPPNRKITRTLNIELKEN